MTTKPITAIVIDQDVETRQLIYDSFANSPLVEVVADTESVIYGYELVRQNVPSLVFIDYRGDGAKTLETVRRITTYFKQVMVVVTGNHFELDTIVNIMQAGGRELLKKPFQPDDVIHLVEKHKNALMNREQGDTSGRLITVFSNKGGLGKTTIAVNLALALSEISKKPVALVDLNLQLGDITTFLDITPNQTIVDIAKDIGRVDETYLKASLANMRFGDASLYVLADPLNVEEAEEITAEQINTILTVMRASFEYVVIDTTTSFDSKTLTALDLADQIMLVSMVNLPCIRSTQRLLTLFQRLGYDEQKVRLIVNRYVPGEEITIEDVEDTLEHNVFWKIPNNYFAIMTAINRGVPVGSLENGLDIYQNFLDFARQTSGLVTRSQTSKPAETPPPQKPSGGLIGGLFGKH